MFRWKPAETGPEVGLRWSVMSGIESEVIEGFKALPKRGAEIGGALLGHRGPQGEFFIESWQPIVIEHRVGPSYILSEADVTLWADFVKRARTGEERFIGIYRSQTRPGLAVTAEDCAIVEKFLPREDGVLLIVKPLSVSESVATFYFCDGGAVIEAAAESREFAFGGKAIPPGAALARSPGLMRTAAAAAGNTAASPAPAPKTGSNQIRANQRWTSVLFAASAIVAGAAPGFYAHSRSGGAAEDPIPAAYTAESRTGHFSLRAERLPQGIRLMWNSRAPVVAGAVGGAVLIDDSGSRAQQQLTPEELRSGSLLWKPKSQQTEFEMRVISAGGREYAESIRVVEPRE
ncbi:MAG TPA: hypothetical protein VG345_11810 [Bryobacteraceae bacterium]|nr:hypothetical protein [Bryobacteraceae bacterium]